MLYPYDPIHVMACANSPGNHDWASQNFVMYPLHRMILLFQKFQIAGPFSVDMTNTNEGKVVDQVERSPLSLALS